MARPQNASYFTGPERVAPPFPLDMDGSWCIDRGAGKSELTGITFFAKQRDNP